MSKRAYGQFCGLARALDVVGERWALLIVRDLLVSPRRFTDLHRGLPKIPTNVLSTRLKELENAGVVRRRLLPRPASGVLYELTEYGYDLEDIVLSLGRWGARTMRDPAPGEIVTPDSLIMAMRSTFRPETARDVNVRYELQFDDAVIQVHVNHGELEAAPGHAVEPDAVIEAGPGIRALMAGEISSDEALTNGCVSVSAGDPGLLKLFADLFRIPSAPPVPAAV